MFRKTIQLKQKCFYKYPMCPFNAELKTNKLCLKNKAKHTAVEYKRKNHWF